MATEDQDFEEMRLLLVELAEAMHEQAIELDKIFVEVEQVTTRLPEYSRLSVITARLAELDIRAKRLFLSPRMPRTG